MKRIIVAASSEAHACIRATLEGHFSFAIAGTLNAARAFLAAPADLVVCTLDFDEGRIFDLLRYVKSMPETRGIPFICVNSSDVLSGALLQSVQVACEALGAQEFVQMAQWRRRLGDQRAFEKMRALLQHCIAWSRD